MAANGRVWLRLGIALAVVGLLVWFLRSNARSTVEPLTQQSPSSSGVSADSGLESGSNVSLRSAVFTEVSATPRVRAGLRGCVRSEAGVPIPGAYVQIEFRSPAGRALPLGLVVADARGEWVRPECPDGILVEIEARAPGFARTRIHPRRALLPGQTESFDIVLGPALVLTARVVDARTGRPIEGARVSIQTTRMSVPDCEQGLTDTEGRCRLAGSIVPQVGAATRRVRASAVHFGYADLSEEREVGDGAFEFRLLPEEASLDVAIEAVGADPAKTRLGMRIGYGEWAGGYEVLEPGEVRHLAGLPAVRVHVSAEARVEGEELERLAWRVVELQPGPNLLTIALEPVRGGGLAGSVVDEFGRSKSAAVLCVTSSQEPGTPGAEFEPAWADTDESGLYSLAGLWPAHYRVTCGNEFGEHFACIPAEYTFELRPGERREHLDFRMVPGITFAGRVVPLFPEHALSLQLLDFDGRTVFVSFQPNLDQAFEFGGLAPGRYRLRLYDRDELAAELELGPDSRNGIELLPQR